MRATQTGSETSTGPERLPRGRARDKVWRPGDNPLAGSETRRGIKKVPTDCARNEKGAGEAPRDWTRDKNGVRNAPRARARDKVWRPGDNPLAGSETRRGIKKVPTDCARNEKGAGEAPRDWTRDKNGVRNAPRDRARDKVWRPGGNPLAGSETRRGIKKVPTDCARNEKGAGEAPRDWTRDKNGVRNAPRDRARDKTGQRYPGQDPRARSGGRVTTPAADSPASANKQIRSGDLVQTGSVLYAEDVRNRIPPITGNA